MQQNLGAWWWTTRRGQEPELGLYIMPCNACSGRFAVSHICVWNSPCHAPVFRRETPSLSRIVSPGHVKAPRHRPTNGRAFLLLWGCLSNRCDLKLVSNWGLVDCAAWVSPSRRRALNTAGAEAELIEVKRAVTSPSGTTWPSSRYKTGSPSVCSA